MDPALRLDGRIVGRAHALARIASGIVVLVGASALVGWMFGVEFLKGFHAGITMKANAAIGLLLSGVSLWILSTRPHHRALRMAGQAFAMVAGAIGAATLGQHVFGWDLGIDQLLFIEAPGALATASPGRMGPPASTCFALAGLSLLLLYRGGSVALAQTAALGIGLMALLGITGYAYSVETLYGVARLTGIALHTAVALFLLGLGLLAATADRGPVSIAAGSGAGSVMTRGMLPFVVLMPLVLGWIRLRLEEAGYYDTRFGLAAMILAIIVILGAVIASTARRLNRVHEQQLAAEAEREALLVREQEARAEAEAANRAKDEFLATISHELRTPLNAIIGWASLLADGVVLGAASRDALAAITRSSKAQAQLIEDLLDISRIRAGMLRLEKRTVDLVAIVAAAVDVVRPMAEEREIELRLRLWERGCILEGDPTRLQQVVWNLLTNAVKFTPVGGIVDVNLEQSDAEAVLAVTDTGEGMNQQFLPHVFERFRQGESGPTRRHGGLGLGLSIAQHLVEMHGGNIEAWSAGPGLGARFTVRLPMHARAEQFSPPEAFPTRPAIAR